MLSFVAKHNSRGLVYHDGMATPNVRPRERVLLLGLLLAFWAIALRGLAVVPPVYEDEPWQASTGWKIARDGVFGSDLFAGYAGMENHYYGHMPLHPLLLAAIFRLAGLGLFQARFEPVVLGLLTLALTGSLGRRLFGDARIGLLAVLFLLAVRLTGLTPFQLSGILLIDISRIARYDMLVPVLGLAALHAYLTARAQAGSNWYLAAGLLAGLAGLGHLYGLFWLPVLVFLALWDGCRRPQLAALLAGALLPWLPYAAYVFGDLHDWRMQTLGLGYASRFDLLNAGWYLHNLLAEPSRYGPGLEPSGPGLLLRPGFWCTLLVLPASILALAWRGLRGDREARALAVPLILFPALFALLLSIKLVNYTVAFVPLAALAGAWGSLALWERLGQTRLRRWGRTTLALLCAAVLVEGAARLAALESAVATTTPYATFIAQVRQYLPPGARVLALHHDWFGLEDYDYRSFAVPLLWTDAHNEPRPLSLDEGLDRIAPDVVLVDRHLRDYLAAAGAQGDPNPARFRAWLARHNGRVLGRVDDPTYGLIEIYAVDHGE
jgi:4-amino-4-deoxy-L-arabinose transferase-like glycosyltransferase